MKTVKVYAKNFYAEIVCKSVTSLPNAASGTHVISFSGITHALVSVDGDETRSTSLAMLEVADLTALLAYDVE